jgi:Tol biopolymer transport system component
MPSVLLPSASLAWALILVVGLAIGALFLRAADEGSSPKRVLPRAAVAVPALAVVALLAIGAVQKPQRSAHTPFAHNGAGTIVFPMAPSGTFHLYEIGADGRGLRQLTHGSDLAPKWSPQGRLAFQRKADVIAAGLRIPGSGRDGEPAWSPDGKRIAFVRNGDLWVAPVGGGGLRKVADDATWPSWGPRLVYEVERGGTTQLRGPAWSPDGRLIAYECLRDDHWDVCIASSDLRLVRVLKTGGDAFAPAWSPDGRRIAFIGDRDGNDQLYVVNADGSGIVRLTTGQADKDAPSWRP